MKNEYDIVVVGGGFAGASAAICAAREGKKVILIEKYNCMGGAACFDLVNPFMPYATGGKALSAGIFTEIVDRLEAIGGLIRSGAPVFEAEYLKFVLNNMAKEAGLELLYQAYMTDVNVCDGKIRSVTVSGTSGKREIFGKCFIDATGDANLSFLAGCSYRLGRDGDSLCQPMTLCFRLSDVDPVKFKEEKPLINPLYKKLQAEGAITNPRENVLIFRTITESIIHFNTTRVVKLNPTDMDDVTKAEIITREQVFEMLNFLKSNFLAFKNAKLIQSGMQVGARESRMIIGEHVLTKDEIMACTKFEDGIAACNYDIDIHSPDGSGTSHYYFPEGTYYTIPYRSLLTKEISNLLVAGRCISSDHDAQASLRIMPVCATLGQAAGVAASIAVDRGCAPKDVDIELLRNKLRACNAVID